MSVSTDRPEKASDGNAPDRAGSGVSAQGVLRSEWIKLRSVRSSTTTMAAAGSVFVLVGLIFAGMLGGVFSSNGGDATSEFANNPAGATLQGVGIAQLIIGVLGVMVITSEYATGMIRSTLAAVPNRLPVLWAKAAVVTAVTFTTMLASALVTFLAGQALIGSGELATASASLGDPGVLRAVVGTAGYLTGVALMGLAAGTLLRSTAAAISTLFGLVFLLPGLGQLLLPASWQDSVLQVLPSNAGSAFTSVQADPAQLSSGVGLAVFLAWVVVPLIAAAVTLKRRNV